jgi:hypothetical protein
MQQIRTIFAADIASSLYRTRRNRLTSHMIGCGKYGQCKEKGNTVITLLYLVFDITLLFFCIITVAQSVASLTANQKVRGLTPTRAKEK